MSKVITVQDGNLVFSIADSGGSIDIGIDGGAVAIGAQSGTGDVALYNDAESVFVTTTQALGGVFVNNTLTGGGSERVLTTADVFDGIIGDITTATPPTTENPTGLLNFYDNDKTTVMGSIGYNADGDLRIWNRFTENDVANISFWINNENVPVAAFQRQAAGNDRGLYIYNIDTNFQDTYVKHVSSNGSVRSLWGMNANEVQFTNFISGGAFTFKYNSTEVGIQINSGTSRDVELSALGNIVLRTLTAANGGCEINNTLTGSGFERVLTASDQSETAGPFNIIADINTATPPTTEAITAQLRFLDLAQDDVIGTLGFEGTNDLNLRNVMREGEIIITAVDTGGTERTILTGDPDAITTLTGDTELQFVSADVLASRVQAAIVTTTDATVTEIIGIAVPSGEGFGFEIHLMGTQDSTGDTVFERVFGAIRNQAGTTALVGSTITDRTDDAGATTWTIAVAADDSADELTVDVTGEAAHTIDWKVRVHLLNV